MIAKFVQNDYINIKRTGEHKYIVTQVRIHQKTRVAYKCEIIKYENLPFLAYIMFWGIYNIHAHDSTFGTFVDM